MMHTSTSSKLRQVIARIGRLQRLNGSAIAFNERKEAELGYLRTRLGEARPGP